MLARDHVERLECFRVGEHDGVAELLALLEGAKMLGCGDEDGRRHGSSLTEILTHDSQCKRPAQKIDVQVRSAARQCVHRSSSTPFPFVCPIASASAKAPRDSP